jgi:hypothetical protein
VEEGVGGGVPAWLGVVLPLSEVETALDGLAPAGRDAVGDALTVPLALTESEGAREALVVALPITVEKGVLDAVLEALPVGEPEGAGVGLPVPVLLPLTDELPVLLAKAAEGALDGALLGACDGKGVIETGGVGVAENDGVPEGVEENVPAMEGDGVGEQEELDVGETLLLCAGFPLLLSEGEAEGVIEVVAVAVGELLAAPPAKVRDPDVEAVAEAVKALEGGGVRVAEPLSEAVALKVGDALWLALAGQAIA